MKFYLAAIAIIATFTIGVRQLHSEEWRELDSVTGNPTCTKWEELGELYYHCMETKLGTIGMYDNRHTIYYPVFLPTESDKIISLNYNFEQCDGYHDFNEQYEILAPLAFQKLYVKEETGFLKTVNETKLYYSDRSVKTQHYPFPYKIEIIEFYIDHTGVIESKCQLLNQDANVHDFLK